MKTNSTLKTLAGIILLIVVLLIAGCSKEKNQQPATNSNNSPYYLTGLLGNESVTISGPSNPYVDTVTVYVDSDGHQWGNPGQYSDSNIIRRTQYLTSAIWTAGNTSFSSPNAVIEGSIQIMKKLSVRVYVAPIPVPAATELYELLTPGNKSISDDTDPTDGVVISLRDSRGVLWTSKGDQDGSSFVITSTGQNMGTYAIITGIMSAKMYDGNGNMKKLTSTAFNAMVGL